MKLMGGFVGVALLVYAFLSWVSPTYTFRYRLTVEVQVGDEVKTGSGVIQVTWKFLNNPQGFQQTDSKVRGQAVLVELGEGRGALLVGLYGRFDPYMGGTRPQHIFLAAYSGIAGMPIARHPPDGFPTSKEVMQAASKIDFPIDLQPNNMPPLRYIRNMVDVNSIVPVRNYQEISNVIGSDVRLKRIWLEMTKDPVTQVLGAKLPWFDALIKAQRGKAILGSDKSFHTSGLIPTFGTHV